MEIPNYIAIEDDISYNAIRKLYPDGSSVLLVADRAIFRDSGWEAREPRVSSVSGTRGSGSDRSMRRARSKLRDIARSTDFEWFITFTLDRAKIDRYDTAEIVRKLNIWLDNRVRRNGLSYVLVPEHHKDGAIHFHGLINDALSGYMVDSGHCDLDGHRIYNLASWGYGFSTAIQLYGDYRRAVGYVCKYIGKQAEKIGGRWYYSGGKLGRPTIQRFIADFDATAAIDGAYVFDIAEADARCVYLDIPAVYTDTQ